MLNFYFSLSLPPFNKSFLIASLFNLINSIFESVCITKSVNWIRYVWLSGDNENWTGFIINMAINLSETWCYLLNAYFNHKHSIRTKSTGVGKVWMKNVRKRTKSIRKSLFTFTWNVWKLELTSLLLFQTHKLTQETHEFETCFKKNWKQNWSKA